MDNKFINNSFTFLRATPEKLAGIFTAYSEALAKIIKKPRLDVGATQNDMFKAAEDKKNETEALKKKTFQDLADLRKEIESNIETANKYLDRELGAAVPAAGVQENLLMETRRQSAWNRIKPILDHKSDGADMVQAVKDLTGRFINNHDPSPLAVDTSDYDSIAALRAELPMYLLGRFPGSSDVDLLEEVMDGIDQTLAAKRPEFTEALNLKKELKAGSVQIQTAINYVQYAVENNETDTVVPAWEKGETATIK